MFHNFLHKKDSDNVKKDLLYGFRTVLNIYKVDNTKFYFSETDGVIAKGLDENMIFKTYDLDYLLQQGEKTFGKCIIDSKGYVVEKEEYRILELIIDNLPEKQPETAGTQIAFELEGFFVVEGTVSEITGDAELFGFDSEEGVWTDLTVSMSTLSTINSIRIGTAMLSESGEFIGLSTTVKEIVT